MSRYARKHGSLDSNHLAIAKTLRDAHISVGETSASGGFCDLVCSNGRHTVLLEIKSDTSAGVYVYLSQLHFAAEWRGHYAFVETAEEAINAVHNPELYCLTSEQKQWIAEYATKHKIDRPKIEKVYLKTFKKAFNARFPQ